MIRWWRRGYILEKYHVGTGRLIPVTPPESRRKFWTRQRAVVEADRLNEVLGRHGTFPQRYRAVKLYGRAR